ncbi:protoporphyrinogen/coproporphyrinogen oxidase [Subtercola sp. RTI3]|uniref:protoporphyrinogen/coproporphyrinogen oxidase n=1 Tax=Subtercola sp. RTI3 TaxID=3048639 RepID=UPI002B23B0A4|nr:FAD-dependent oxidoreductase [Subtercola sp. RTI3]MEA9986117.1 FAD-dependent oxidoreductase [Subtercola sp. RTI3]
MALKSIVVIGAGVGGLVAARELARKGFGVTLLDAADEAGGCVATHTVAGIRLDSGAESYATRGGTVARFLAEIGLADAIVSPNPAGAWVQLDGFAAPLPKNTLLGIPGVPLADDVRRIIGWSGAIRAQLDRYMPLVRVRRETDLGDIVRRRMGQKVLDRLVAPIVSGVHSAHPDLVDVHAVAPGLTAAMTTQGSLSGAVMSLIARRAAAAQGARPDITGASAANGVAGARAGSAVGGIDGGMYRLVDALVADCARLGVDVRLGSVVAGIRRVPNNTPGQAEWMTVLGDGAVLGSHGVVVAAGFRAALALLASMPPADAAPSDLAGPAASSGLGDLSEPSDLAALTRSSEWPGSSAVTLATLVLDAPALDAAPRGSGVLVAEDVTSVGAKALTHATAKWPWLARDAGPGRHVVRLSYGRGGEGQAPSAVTQAQALADASTLLDTPLDETMVQGFALTEWRDSLAFATGGHRARVDELVEAIHEHPGLEVVGAWISGTGLAYVIDGSRVKASELAARLHRS